jgi:hypothetical protein
MGNISSMNHMHFVRKHFLFDGLTMTPKKQDNKLSMGQRCGIAFLLIIFAAVAAFLGLNELGEVESMGLPEIFAFIPLGIAVMIVLAALCILAGVRTPKARKGVYVRSVYR